MKTHMKVSLQERIQQNTYVGGGEKSRRIMNALALDKSFLYPTFHVNPRLHLPYHNHLILYIDEIWEGDYAFLIFFSHFSSC